MALVSQTAQEASLDNDYGTTRGPNALASHELALYDGDPREEGVEISGNGYARVTVAAADWALASDGYKTLTTPVTFPAPTAEWPLTVRYWALLGGGVMWDSGPFAEEIDVTAASPAGPVVNISIFYNDAVPDPT